MEPLHEDLFVSPRPIQAFKCSSLSYSKQTVEQSEIHIQSQIGFSLILTGFEATKQRDFFSLLSENSRTVGLILIAFHIEGPWTNPLKVVFACLFVAQYQRLTS
jgi:hypothetical protein